jgi:hypothetical protein
MPTVLVHPLALPLLAAFARHDTDAIALLLADAAPDAGGLLCDALAVSVLSTVALARELGADIGPDELAEFWSGVCVSALA